MPPGPRPIPFFGNKFQLPKSKPWIKLQEWSEVYGPIFTVWFGRTPTIVICDPNIAVDLMEKRSTKYSSRPRMVAMGEILWDGASILVQPYGKEWSIRRKLLHQALTPKALRLYKPVQTAEASKLCYQLLETPSNWEKLLERFTSSIVFSVAYGHRIDSLNADVIHQRFKFMHRASSLNVPGRYMVESFPILKHVPDVLAPWKTEIKAFGREEAAANMALVNVVRDDIARAKTGGDDIPDSLCKLLLEMREKEHIPLSERDFSYIPASLFGAGSDTTASTLCTAFLALVMHPEALQAAHLELDTVVGLSHTPTFDDEKDLPYLCALVKEVLRWRPVAVLGGTPHASTEDDYYEGYYIPAGTTVLGNSWAINLNDEYYHDPHRFSPNRFLDTTPIEFSKAQATSGGKTHPAKAGHSSFGWGRRICPGAGLAENSLFIALAKIIWAFNILPIKGVSYNSFAYTEGFNIRPQKFSCEISIRSETHRQVLEDDLRAAETVLQRFTPFEE
ncbi:cytochrome P450 [Phaeosphaeriaceae sp. PMI808]|nr:cytochrome P450 [Phaeosphaeriaceae sp. PMI808]